VAGGSPIPTPAGPRADASNLAQLLQSGAQVL
jgi:hypothetical protein